MDADRHVAGTFQGIITGHGHNIGAAPAAESTVLAFFRVELDGNIAVLDGYAAVELFKTAGKGDIAFLFSLHVDGITAANGDDVGNIFRRTAAGQIHDRLGQALEERSQGRSPGQVFQYFIADIAGNEVRENEDIGLTGYGRTRCFLAGNARYQRGIGLHFAVEFKIDIAVPQQADGLADAVDFFAGTAAHGRIR